MRTISPLTGLPAAVTGGTSGGAPTRSAGTSGRQSRTPAHDSEAIALSVLGRSRCKPKEVKKFEKIGIYLGIAL
jgi:hypothetical protein